MMLSLQRSTLEQHRKFLQRLCRTCGKKTMKESDEAKGKKAKLAAVYEDKIKNVFRVDLRDDDNVNVHPPHICHVCYSRLFLRRTQAADPQPLLWKPHPRTGQCSIRTIQMWKATIKVKVKSSRSSQKSTHHH